MRALVSLVLALLDSAAQDWATQGHKGVALLAEQQLFPQARDQAQKLLALDPRLYPDLG